MALTDLLPDSVERAEEARLIPVVADSAKEQRAVSVLLATMMAVDDFARAILRRLNAPTGRRARVACFTEVTFKAIEGAPQIRPDGLIIVTQGNTQWRCLVEAKIGRAELETPQIENYLALARDNKIDAVVTVSNQFREGNDLPVQIDARKLRTTKIAHLSWKMIVSDAILLLEHQGIEDTEQAFLMREMIRYFSHESTGVTAFSQMGSHWKELCTAFQQNIPPGRDATATREAIRDWLDLSHYLAIALTLAIGRSVTVALTREHTDFPDKRIAYATDQLTPAGLLRTEFDIPDAAARLVLSADAARRTVSASMRLKTPGDLQQAKAKVTWLLRQLQKCSDEAVLIRASWPGRLADSSATLGKLRADKAAILPAQYDGTPTTFEIIESVDLGQNFRSARKFVEATEALVLRFYGKIGENLRAWAPSPPKIVEGSPAGTAAAAPPASAEVSSEGQSPADQPAPEPTPPAVTPAQDAQGG